MAGSHYKFISPVHLPINPRQHPPAHVESRGDAPESSAMLPRRFLLSRVKATLICSEASMSQWLAEFLSVKHATPSEDQELIFPVVNGTGISPRFYCLGHFALTLLADAVEQVTFFDFRLLQVRYLRMSL